MNLISTILAIGGALLLATAGYRAGHTWLFLDDTRVVPGQVVEIKEVPVRNGGIAYAPVVAAALPDGRSVTFLSGASSVPAGYTQGQPVDVRYRLANPDEAEIDDFRSLWLGTLALAITGAVLLAIGGITGFLQNANAETLARLDAARITGGLFAVAGPLMLLAATIQSVSTLHFYRSSQTATGVVERLVQVRETASPSFVLFPVVAFETANRRVHFMGENGSYPAAYEAGQQVGVRYPADFPEKARIDAWFEIWTKALVLLGIGVGMTLMGWLLLHVLADAVAAPAMAAEAQPPFEHQLFVAEHAIVATFVERDGGKYLLQETLKGDPARLRLRGNDEFQLNTAMWQLLGKTPAPRQRVLLLLSAAVDEAGRHNALELYPLDARQSFVHAADDAAVRRALTVAEVREMLSTVPFDTTRCGRSVPVGDYLLCFAEHDDKRGRLFRFGVEIAGTEDGQTIDADPREGVRLIFRKATHSDRGGWEMTP